MSLKIESSEKVNVLDDRLISAITEETVKLNETSGSFEDAFRKAKKKYGVE